MKASNFLLFCAVIMVNACTKSDNPDNGFIGTSSNAKQQLPNLKIDSTVAIFMDKYNIPGVTLAVARNGKMIYRKGYGFADVAAERKVQISNVFRISALSKTFTVVAIMKLVEDNRLHLDTKVFGSSGILGTVFGKQAYNTNLLNITVRDLMQEIVGGWRDDHSDPMLSEPDLSVSQLISRTLDNQMLTAPPGTTYTPSNFAYCLLGRIIEKISGISYADYIKIKVFEPCGISDMLIAGNTQAERKPDEVLYYGYNDEDPYGFNITRMDASEGWLASAEDVLRFLVSTDNFPTKVDLLSPSSIATITTPSVANPAYGSGWFIDHDNWWNNGSLPGASSVMIRTGNGFCWVVLCNSRSLQPGYTSDLNNLMWSVVNDKNTTWPDTRLDLF